EEIEPADSIYVTVVNASVTAGSGTIFTSDFNDTNTITTNEANLKWVTFFTAKPTSAENVFEVVAVDVNADGLPYNEITIPEGGFIYTGHCDDRDMESEIYVKSSANLKAISNLSEGDLVTVTGVDFTTGTVAADANITAGASDVSLDDITSEDTSKEESKQESDIISTESDKDGNSSEVKDDTSKEESRVNSVDNSDAESEKNNTILYIGLGVAAIVLIAVIAYIATKKKK
ncbi:MAG TPA: hypothetical protein DD733_02010, partial [Clostridiales bacterium]|nr:hypothetical protein [Clostridiales bacterium]